jgi:hypothetical protein
MKTICRRLIVTGLVAVLVMGVVRASAFADDKAKGLAGSWRVTITGGAGTPELPTWYQALVTFTADGGLVATITDPFFSTQDTELGANTRKTRSV